MVRHFVLAAAAVALVLAACSKSGGGAQPAPGQAPKGLPPAAEVGGAPPAAEGKVGDTGAPAPNPHAGTDLGGADNPHAAGMGGSPHGAMGEAADPALIIEGTLEAGAAQSGKVKPGDVVYVVAKAADPQTGAPTGGVLAVARVVLDRIPMPFQLGLASKPQGKVVVSARDDHDNEARSRSPGDVEGAVVVLVPAKGVKLVLDKPVE